MPSISSRLKTAAHSGLDTAASGMVGFGKAAVFIGNNKKKCATAAGRYVSSMGTSFFGNNIVSAYVAGFFHRVEMPAPTTPPPACVSSVPEPALPPEVDLPIKIITIAANIVVNTLRMQAMFENQPLHHKDQKTNKKPTYPKGMIENGLTMFIGAMNYISALGAGLGAYNGGMTLFSKVFFSLCDVTIQSTADITFKSVLTQAISLYFAYSAYKLFCHYNLKIADQSVRSLMERFKFMSKRGWWPKKAFAITTVIVLAYLIGSPVLNYLTTKHAFRFIPFSNEIPIFFSQGARIASAATSFVTTLSTNAPKIFKSVKKKPRPIKKIMQDVERLIDPKNSPKVAASTKEKFLKGFLYTAGSWDAVASGLQFYVALQRVLHEDFHTSAYSVGWMIFGLYPLLSSIYSIFALNTKPGADDLLEKVHKSSQKLAKFSIFNNPTTSPSDLEAQPLLPSTLEAIPPTIPYSPIRS